MNLKSNTRVEALTAEGRRRLDHARTRISREAAALAAVAQGRTRTEVARSRQMAGRKIVDVAGALRGIGDDLLATTRAPHGRPRIAQTALGMARGAAIARPLALVGAGLLVGLAAAHLLTRRKRAAHVASSISGSPPWPADEPDSFEVEGDPSALTAPLADGLGGLREVPRQTIPVGPA